MNKHENNLTEYIENVRYYSETSTVSELPAILKNVYDQVKTNPDVVNESLVQALDLNVRQLLKNTLTERLAYSELPFLQKAITIAESVLRRAQDKSFVEAYLPRWHFANDVIQDRKHELLVNKEKFAIRPQVRQLIEMLASKSRISREEIEAKLNVTKQRATNLVRDMKALSLLEEFVPHDDKRKREYTLSVDGKNLCRKIGIEVTKDEQGTSAIERNKVGEQVRKAIQPRIVTITTVTEQEPPEKPVYKRLAASFKPVSSEAVIVAALSAKHD